MPTARYNKQQICGILLHLGAGPGNAVRDVGSPPHTMGCPQWGGSPAAALSASTEGAA